MADPNPTHPPGNRALSRLVFDEVHRALRRHRLAAEDRDDVAQMAVQTAFERWSTFRDDVGTLRNWIGGIVHNEVREFRRARARRVLHEVEHASHMPASEVQTPEGDVSARELFDRLIVQVPIEQRRMLYLVKFAEHTIREAAEWEGISLSTAHARYKAGLKAFTKAAERWREEQKQLGVVPLPLTVADIFAGGRPPPAPDEDFERVWARMAAKLDLHDDAPPESGPRRTGMVDADPPSSRPPTDDPSWLVERKRALLRKLGIFLGVLGILLPRANTGSVPEEQKTDAGRAAAAVAPPPPAAATGSGTVTAREAWPTASTSEMEAPPAPRPPPPATPPPASARARAHGPADALDDEIELLDRGRTALDGGHPAEALAVCAEHVRRFPHGQAADGRRRLWRDACAQLRDRAPGGGPATARCAQQP